jgi:hypothetical protein
VVEDGVEFVVESAAGGGAMIVVLYLDAHLFYL